MELNVPNANSAELQCPITNIRNVLRIFTINAPITPIGSKINALFMFNALCSAKINTVNNAMNNPIPSNPEHGA